jgi:hypothetical protein
MFVLKSGVRMIGRDRGLNDVAERVIEILRTDLRRLKWL